MVSNRLRVSKAENTEIQPAESIKKADTTEIQTDGSTEKADTTDKKPGGSIKKVDNTTNGKSKKPKVVKTVSSVDKSNKTDSKAGIKKKDTKGERNTPVTRKLPTDSSDDEIIDSEPVVT